MVVDALLLTMACFLAKANSVENIYSDNGWRPTSIEKVLELQRNFIKATNVQLPTLENSPKRPINEIGQGNFVKIIQKNELIKPIEDQEFLQKRKDDNQDYNKYIELIRIVQPPYEEMTTVEDKVLKWETGNDSQSIYQPRKAKKIENSNILFRLSNTNPNRIESNDKTIIRQHTSETDTKDIGSISRLNKTYEVKENTEDEKLASNQKVFFNSEFKYEKAADGKNNLTINLLKILANYNIRTGDKLPNYAISLRPNSRNSHNHDFVLMHVPIKVPLRYNNANHLPVDPLLAVFLSNYGHYLPNFYGFRRGYNNLYGYLASNNMHNNKPFGSYKIFSDTDSSH